MIGYKIRVNSGFVISKLVTGALQIIAKVFENPKIQALHSTIILSTDCRILSLITKISFNSKTF
jgi:hypothetical protein